MNNIQNNLVKMIQSTKIRINGEYFNKLNFAKKEEVFKNVLKRKNQFLGCIAHDLRSPIEAVNICLNECSENIELFKKKFLNKNTSAEKIEIFKNISKFIEYAYIN